METVGGGRIWEKHPSPKAAGEKVENWKQPQALNEKGRKEIGEGLNSIKTINKGSAKAATRSSLPGGALVGRANPQEQSGVREVLGPHGEKRFHCWKDIWQRLLKPPGPGRPRKTATVAGAGTRSLRVKPGARCVL